MQISIRDFMGCREADIEVNHIALLGGRNAQGKSSTCRAIAYALSGQAVPTGLNKGAAAALIRSGAAKGSVEVKTEDGVVTLSYPKALLASDGMPPRSSIWAAGIKTVAELPDKERVETLRDIIGAMPVKEDFVSEAVSCGIEAKHIEPLWSLVEKDGWEAAHKKGQDKGREIKAQWEYATGEKYGEKKAETWLPHNWSAGIEHTSRDALEAIVTGARADLETQIAAAAVDEEKRDQLRQKAERIDELAAKLQETKDAEKKAQSEAEECAKELAALPRGVQKSAQACPHCSGSLFVENGTITKAEGLLSQEEITARAEAHARATQRLEQLRDLASAARKESAAAFLEHQAAVKAATELHEMPKGGNATQADIDAAREALRTAEHDLKAWTQKSEADRLHKSVLANQQIVDLLSPEGVRRKVLVRALARFNAELKDTSDRLGWSPVTVTPDLDVEYNGRGYFFLSESEKFRARVTLQIRIAEIENASAIVIDGADILDAAGRNGMFQGISKLKIPTIVGMTWLQKPEAMPDMEKIGCGKSYWVSAGSVTPLTTAVQAGAA